MKGSGSLSSESSEQFDEFTEDEAFEADKRARFSALLCSCLLTLASKASLSY